MGTFSLSGGVEVLGFISPTDPSDNYPVIDPLYGIDGFRNVDTLSDLNDIPELRRRAGMVVGVSGGTTYYKLNPGPWNLDITDWSLFQTGGGGNDPFTGGSGNCITEFYVEEIFSCDTGITIHNDFIPVTDNTINLGSPIKRFRDINTVSGTTTVWTATTKVYTPELDLGLDSLGNSRVITANNSIIQDDTLNGGIF
jgi:hypothetical protein